ncbi:DNA-binding transcriptional LysR family regulator [Crossiella equi]|uniref:DNA-binding transcriptional LysR family regulator n=2 Tax=Crossiella equi TaxID=130796 RepID=A0ABS5ARV0_9PSEU|nr:DNA-binding transcriptional LysR family regulator [Crossiella equi]
MGWARVDAARAARGKTGQLRVGFIGSALLAPLPGVIGRFRRTHPDVRLTLQELDSPASAAALLSGDLDVPVGREERSASPAWPSVS